MDFIAEFIVPYLLLYKYWAIFIITLVAALAFPIPPGTLLMASSAFASQGYLSLFWVIAIGSLGNIVGDNIGYFLARRYGRPILYRIGFGKILDSQKYKNIEERMRRRPGALIFFSRFEVISNLCVNLMCGLGKVPYGKYLLYESLGEIAQVAIYCTIGYFVGDNWQMISGIISKFLILILIVGLALIVIYRKKIWARITRPATEE
jgi:membrane protein DedA with SNARE-associated domain